MDSSNNAPRLCDHAGCQEAGEFRAPKKRDTPKDFYWFCLEHVKEYNKSWDYYQGMSSEEIERSRIDDVTWNRPTRKFHPNQWSRFERAIKDHVQGYDEVSAYERRNQLPDDCKQALGVMEMTFPFTQEELKAQYKKLVKKYHPDMNKGDKGSEEKFKKINHAHNVLRKFLRP